MGILGFFRRKKIKRQRIDVQSYTIVNKWEDLIKHNENDPYDGKIASAINLQDNGRDDEAEILLRQVIEEKEGHVRAWLLLGQHFIKKNEKGRALYCFEKVLKYQPTNEMVKNITLQLNDIVRKRPDYLWEYNQERGLI